MKKILLAGESWVSYTVQVKGFDSIYFTSYGQGAEPLIEALTGAGFELDFLDNERAGQDFPYTKEELSRYQAVILSDIGSNTLLLGKETFYESRPKPNRLASLRDYVAGGGALLMIGGYLSFTGIDAKARYGMTPIADLLPVSLLASDDRIECPEGKVPELVDRTHPVVKGIEGPWPALLGYNRTLPKKGGGLVARIGQDPLLVVGNYGRGRTAVFTSDCSPHWGPKAFMEWEHYPDLWVNLLAWLCKSD